MLPAFAGRILNFDLSATQAYADLMAKAEAAEQPIGMADGLIAAMARIHGLAVATCDTAPFAAAGIPVINPWIEGRP